MLTLLIIDIFMRKLILRRFCTLLLVLLSSSIYVANASDSKLKIDVQPGLQQDSRNFIVSGQILDEEDKEPLIGAIVMIKG